MYAGGAGGTVAQGLSAVEVSPIEGKSGWLVRNALVDRLGSGKSGSARYRLDVRLDDKVEGLGLLSDDTVARERRTLRARYQLVDLATGKIVLDETAGSDAGIDVVSSEYATIAAEQTALENLSKEVADRIVVRVALKLRSGDAAAK
jgi:LPS-assembly lipoprotein